MTRIGIIIGSTRPGRKADVVAQWVHDIATRAQHRSISSWSTSWNYELPFLDEEVPPSFGQYANAHTKKWAEKIATFDGFIFVTPEYNHSVPGALKNALDFVYGEWNNKAAGFVGYGSLGGVRAVEHLRVIMAELQVADVRTAVALSIFTDFENFTDFKPGRVPARVRDRHD